jgi:hypothetical protein
MACPASDEQDADNAPLRREDGERPADGSSDSAGPCSPEFPAGPPSQRLPATALVLACAGLVTWGLADLWRFPITRLVPACAALGLSLASVILGTASLARVRRNPIRHSGVGLAVVSLLIGAWAVVGLTMVLAAWIRAGTSGPVVFPQSPVGIAVRMLNPPRPREGSVRSTGQTNLWTIGLAASMWSKDHKGQYPPTLDVLVESGYLDENMIEPVMDGSYRSQPRIDGLRQYQWVGALPSQIPDHTIAAFTRRGVLMGGRFVLYADLAVEWRTEEELTGPNGLLTQSYARLVEALGDQLTEERSAELRRFHEIDEDGQAP